MYRGWFGNALCAVTITALIALTCTLDAQSSKSKTAPNVKNMERSLKAAKDKERKARAELSKTRRAVRQVKGTVNELDTRLSKLEGDLENTTNRLEKSREIQKETATALQAATTKLNSQQAQVRARLRWMYMRGESNVAGALLGSESMSDFASRSFLLQRVAKADRALFENFKQTQLDYKRKKARADALVREVADLKESQRRQQGALEETREDKVYLLGQLREKQADLEALVRQLDAEENAIEARIRAYYASLQKSSGNKPLPKYTGGRLMRPVSAPITSRYGMRFHPILKRNRLHAGVDFGARSGTPIVASADGVVITASYSRGYGNMIVIDHGGGISTLYGHCSRLFVGSGARVRRGQRIGAVGSTGLSTGPHLHFEVRVNGRPVNPLSYL